ncbi:MAG: transcriptional repressor [Prevotellaceae bacterium]|jgi:Fe2+ or Zn2+ uptake regulation protein|nr:transcriptional repressor [Prevotellaceae bacterium]
MDKPKRNTKTKQMVMDVLDNASTALSHDDIGARLGGTMDRVTLYRILQSFCEDGKVHRIFGNNGKTYYARCRGCVAGAHHDNHPHFRCLRCEAITCIERPLAAQPLPAGYRAAAATALIVGYCPECFENIDF